MLLTGLLFFTTVKIPTSCVQPWKSRGPNNIDPVSPMVPDGIGCLAAIFMPANSQTLYLGSVNGGVWKTTNFFATPQPHYIPLTDMNLCQSVSALSYSLTDPNFIAYGE